MVASAAWGSRGLGEALAEGIEQYVIVGAGLDSFALRRPDLSSRLAIFELDHPGTQRAKRDRLASLARKLPDQLEFAPIDFEAEAVDAALARSSFSGEKRAFFSWLGTVSYLSDEAVFSVLAALSSLASVGSQLVFDYAVPDDLLSDADRRMVVRLRRFTARRGEPVGELGYRVLENLAPAEQDRRYFSDRSDGFSAFSGSYYVRLAVVA